jgi:hypothetical protein
MNGGGACTEHKNKCLRVWLDVGRRRCRVRYEPDSGSLVASKMKSLGGAWWHMPIIPATQEVEIRRITV